MTDTDVPDLGKDRTAERLECFRCEKPPVYSVTDETSWDPEAGPDYVLTCEDHVFEAYS